MKFLKRILKVILQILYAISRINWWRVYQLHDKNADIVVLLSTLVTKKMGIEILCWDLGYIKFLTQNNQRFTIAFSFKKLHDKMIFWSPSKLYARFDFTDYAAELVYIAQQLEKQNCKIYPTAYEVKYLENKAFMYEEFEKREVNTPKTFILHKVDEIELIEASYYPLLLKGEHSSGSADIFKFQDIVELRKFLNETNFLNENASIILQQLLEIRRDLRVTLVGEDVVLFYWRINPHKEWRPTASSYGSFINFDNFPNQWKFMFVEAMKKLELSMCAFDVAWQNDDITTIPYFLEVSPRFSPNPPVILSEKLTYSKFKKQLLGKNTYYKAQTDLIFQISAKYMGQMLKNVN